MCTVHQSVFQAGSDVSSVTLLTAIATSGVGVLRPEIQPKEYGKSNAMYCRKAVSETQLLPLCDKRRDVMCKSVSQHRVRQNRMAFQSPLLATTIFSFPLPVWAALPTPVAPSTAPPAGDWIGLIQGYIKDGGLVLGLAIAVLGFLWIAYLGFAKFNEARQGKAEWAEVGVLGIVGAIVLIFASYLLTEAAGVI